MANITREFSYRHVDYSLTTRGQLQAEQTALFLEGRDISAVYTSPLRRALETAEIIASRLNLPVRSLEDLREINVGDLERRPPTTENWELHDSILRLWRDGRRDEMFPGGEDYHTLLARAKRALREIVENCPDQRAVVVGHGGMMAMIIRDLCSNVAEHEPLAPVVHNCAVTEVELCIRDGAPTGVLKGWAVCAHLSGDAEPKIYS